MGLSRICSAVAAALLALGVIGAGATIDRPDRPLAGLGPASALTGPRRFTFDGDAPGGPPAGFDLRSVGPGREPRWVVEVDPTAPSPRQVLVQRDNDDTNHRYPMALVADVEAADVAVTVRAKAISGVRDRSFGLVARMRDPRNGYIARANTSDWGNNIRLYSFIDGKRRQLAEWEGDIPAGIWHIFAFRLHGDELIVELDGVRVMRHHDRTFTGPGRVGLWTKAEAVAAFDDLTVEPIR